jgi:oxalate decarboxylase/phosphoglucose isomerase-like protein (cupin superfamily)
MSSLLTFGETWVLSPETFLLFINPGVNKIITLNKWLVIIIVLFYLHSSAWFTNPVGTNLVMFNLYKKKKTT